MSSSEALNLKIWLHNYPANTYLNGILLFVAGLAIIRVHQYLHFNWKGLMTLTGWCALLLGCFRICFPENPQAGQHPLTYMILLLLLITGTIISYKGYLSKG